MALCSTYLMPKGLEEKIGSWQLLDLCIRGLLFESQELVNSVLLEALKNGENALLPAVFACTGVTTVTDWTTTSSRPSSSSSPRSEAETSMSGGSTTTEDSHSSSHTSSRPGSSSRTAKSGSSPWPTNQQDWI